MSFRKNLSPLIFLRFYFGLTALLASTFIFGRGFVNPTQPDRQNDSGELSADSSFCAILSNDTLKRFVRFDHSDGSFNYYFVRLSMFNTRQERGYFYQAARSAEIFIVEKSDIDKDSTLFKTGNTDKIKTLRIFSDLYDQTIYTRKSHLFDRIDSQHQSFSPSGVPTCSEAKVSCSGNVYTFPSGTTGQAPPPILGYPNYGCLGSEPCPAYYYMQVSVAGDIIIYIDQGSNDVDFICWGPFTSLTDGCNLGLTGTCSVPLQPTCCNNNQPGCLNFYPRGNITDCSYSGNPQETCHILNAQPGQIYILLLTNFSQQPGSITFSQTGGTGVTDCNIVVHCSMVAMTANPSVCDGLTNTFSVSGNIEFSNPPPTGTLTITDNTAVPPVTQTLLPPFISPKAYNLTGIPCDGLVHTLTAAFSDSVACTMNSQITSPPASCPSANISGGGEICNDGISTVTVGISLTGIAPFDFTYALNGVPQPAITNYSGPSPYVFNTNQAGTYTLVSIANSICTGPGMISGSAIVTLNPLPLPTIAGPANVCVGSSGIVYSTEAGMTNYTWTISGGGIITAGGGMNSNTVTVTWNTAGSQSVSINYHDSKGCTAPTAFVYPVIVNPLPVPTITGSQNLCQGTTGAVYTSEADMTNYSWAVSAGGTITSGGTATDNTVTVTWNTAGAQTVSVNYNNANNCTASTPVVYPVTVHPLPVPTLAGPSAYCTGSAGAVYTTQAGMTNYQWVVSAGGTVTAGGGPANNTITVTWNTAGAQTVSVNYNDANGCTALLPVVYNVTVNPLPVPAVAGPASVCLNSTATYSAVAGMSNYTWSVSAGGTITSGTGTNSINVLWSTTGAKTITLNYNDANGCTASSATIYNVTVNLLPVPALAGLNQICVGNSTTYTTDAGMNNYSWNISAGGSVTSGGSTTDNTVTVLWNATGAQTVSVNYVMGSGCTAPSPTVFNVTVHSLPVPTIAGTNSLCAGSTGITYSTQPGMTNYQWVVSAGGTITAGGGPANNTVTVTWNTPGAQTVRVNYNDANGCTALLPVIENITVNPLPVPTIAGPGAVCLNSTSVFFTEAGMTNYIWAVSPGGTITAGTGTNSITVLWNTTGAKTVSVNYSDVNSCNAALPSTLAVNVSNLPVPALLGINSVCTGNSAVYSTDPGMTAYSWSVTGGGSITAGGGPADNTVTITWNTAGLQSVTVNYQAGPGCSAPSPTVLAVNVKPRPAVTNAANSSVCSATTLAIPLFADLPFTTFTWTATASSGNITGFTNGGGFSITDHLVNSGSTTETVTYAVLPSLNGCDGTVSNFIVSVHPVANVTFTPNGQSFCSGGSTNIALTSNVGVATFTWTATGSSGNITGFGPGAVPPISQVLTNTGFSPESVIYTVQPTAFGCPGTPGNDTVKVSPAPAVTLTPCTDIITTTDAVPFTLKGGIPLGGSYSGTGVNTGIFYPSLAGTGVHSITYSYTSINGCTSTNSVNITVSSPAAFTCDNPFMDVRDNNQYTTVKIGTQCWMSSNLNFGNIIPSSSTQRDNCIVEKYCLNDNPANCTSLGALYEWDEMMRFDVTQGIQGLCPPAWHLPSEAEWTTLFNFYISNGFAGSPLKSTGYSGFNALMMGADFFNRTFTFNNFAGFIWSSTSHGPAKAWAHAMNNFNPSVSFYPSSRSNAFSVRCIKD